MKATLRPDSNTQFLKQMHKKKTAVEILPHYAALASILRCVGSLD